MRTRPFIRGSWTGVSEDGMGRLRILNELGTLEMLRDARSEPLEQARSEASRAGAVGLAVGIGANIAALVATL